MYPSLFVLFKEAVETYQKPNDSLIIEKGEKIMIPMSSIHFDPWFYTDHQNFEPERFLKTFFLFDMNYGYAWVEFILTFCFQHDELSIKKLYIL